MNFASRQVTMLITAIMIVTASHSAHAGELHQDIDALASYRFGDSRAPLQRIADAVHAAAAGLPESPCTVDELESLFSDMLVKNISVEAKRFICRLLGEIGGARAIDALSQTLRDESLFSAALVALEQNPSSESANALLNALTNATPEKRAAILAALGRQGNPDSIAALTEALDDAAPAIMVAAAQALADVAHPDACRALTAKIMDAATETWLLLADACLNCAETLRDEDANAALEMLEKLRRPEFPTHIRIAAIDGLMRCSPEKARELLLEALQDDNAELAHDALMLARVNPATEVVKVLTSLLQQAANERKPALLSILSDFGDASALPAVLEMADHEQPEVRRAALHTIGVLGNAEQTDFLLERGTSGSAAEQRIAREVLARLADPATDAKLLAIATGRGDEAVRIAAINALAERRAEDAAQALSALAIRSAPAIREASVKALRVLAPPAMLPDLLKLAAPRGLEPIREVPAQTLAQTALRIPEPAVRADAVIAALNNASDATVRILLLETLSLIGGDQAFEAIRSYPETTDTEIRRAVVDTLSRFQSPEALGELRGILLIERDEGVRARAYSGYVAALRNAAQMALYEVTSHIETACAEAKNTAEKREFLAAITQLPSLATLEISREMTSDDTVAAEALRALLQLSVALAGAYPDEARESLEQVIAAKAATDAMLQEAQQALNFTTRFDGHIMAWAVAGPYYEANTSAEALFSREFPPEVNADNANWRILRTFPDAEPAYALELDRVIGGDDRVAFLRTKITAAEEGDAVLELGTNDGCRVWWNNTLVHGVNTGRALVPGEDKVTVQLTAGENDLMIAVFQHGAAWRATARLVDQNGQTLPGIVCRPAIAE